MALGAASGTPMTGRVWCAATAPARCAAPPAAAMTTFTPRPASPRDQSRTSSGVRCADSTRVSCSIPRPARVSSVTAMIGASLELPMTIATCALSAAPSCRLVHPTL